MHGGSIDKPTAAGRVYRVLAAQAGAWVGGWDLAQLAQTTAVSTQVSAVRIQLDARGNGERVEVEQRGKHWYYRLVSEPKQLELIA